MKSTLAVLVVLLLALSGCAPAGRPAQPPAPTVKAEPPEETQDALVARMAALPGGELSTGESSPTVVYAEGTLYARGAVLPLPGGAALLEPLAALFKETPQRRWRLLLAAHTGEGEAYDRSLAEERRVLLQRYLQRRGIDLARLEFVVAAAGGSPLQVALIPEDQASSSETSKE